MKDKGRKFVLKDVVAPEMDFAKCEVELTVATMNQRKEAVINKMNERNVQALIVYADLEHGSNFEYLVGFLPRFEEALLVLHNSGEAYLVLGNENLNKSSKARIKNIPIHAPHFSLPNQPMDTNETFTEILRKTQIEGKKIGIVGWKNFTSKIEDNKKMFDIPQFIVESLKEICGSDALTNECTLFIGEKGVRRVNNANEIAHYEFGSSLASDCMQDAINNMQVGVSEFEIADKLNRYGQWNSVVTIATFGPRFVNANMYPSSRKLAFGDTVSLTIGYKGGLSSRAGYAVRDECELNNEVMDYVSKVCIPYFNAIVTLLESSRCGISGGEIYDEINDVLPQDDYKWGLCPGHLVADEEWMSSPIYKNSTECLESGMIFQTDIIPQVSGYTGVSVESTYAIADEKLREQIKMEYPELWNRIKKRQEYIREVTGVKIGDEILPMAAALSFYKPLLLGKKALVLE
ncbi:MAG: M24 family metallopeptidase [Anaerorhabdus sp.]